MLVICDHVRLFFFSQVKKMAFSFTEMNNVRDSGVEIKHIKAHGVCIYHGNVEIMDLSAEFPSMNITTQ